MDAAGFAASFFEPDFSDDELDFSDDEPDLSDDEPDFSDGELDFSADEVDDSDVVPVVDEPPPAEAARESVR